MEPGTHAGSVPSPYTESWSSFCGLSVSDPNFRSQKQNQLEIPTTYALKDRTILILAGGWAGPPLGLVTVPGNPSSVFHVSAVPLLRVPSARICACASLHRAFAAALAWQTLVSWSQILLVMMSISAPVSFLVSRGFEADVGGIGRRETY